MADSPIFRRVVRANRLIAEGKCPSCEMDYKPQLAKLETELRDTRRALELLLTGILEEEDDGATPEDIAKAVALSMDEARRERTEEIKGRLGE